MDRFFSPTNLDRYRRLANGTGGAVEQHQLLDELAAEMSAFRREARLVAVRPSSLSKERIASHWSHQL